MAKVYFLDKHVYGFATFQRPKQNIAASMGDTAICKGRQYLCQSDIMIDFYPFPTEIYIKAETVTEEPINI